MLRHLSIGLLEGLLWYLDVTGRLVAVVDSQIRMKIMSPSFVGFSSEKNILT